MITVISGTNRPDSNTHKIAEYCFNYLNTNSEVQVLFLNLIDLNKVYFDENMYNSIGQHPLITQIQDTVIVPSNKWLIVSPEYNGSFPGILKLFIDALSVRKYSESFANKKVALIGVASGRSGNLRWMDHLTGMLNYLKMIVMPEKLPISSIENAKLDAEKLNIETSKEIERFLKDMIRF